MNDQHASIESLEAENKELRDLLRYSAAYIGKAISDGYLANCAVHPEKLLGRINEKLCVPQN